MDFNLRGVVFGIAIFVLTLFVTTYGLNTIYPKPLYEDYCPNVFWDIPEMNEEVCFEHGGKWDNYDRTIEGNVTGYCDKDYTCREAYDLDSERRSMNVFLVAIPLGILILLGGFYFFSLEAVGVGLMLGGIGTMLRGIGSYWRYSEDWLRFLISLIGLVIVIYFSYRFGEKLGGKKGRKKIKK